MPNRKGQLMKFSKPLISLGEIVSRNFYKQLSTVGISADWFFLRSDQGTFLKN